MTPNEKSLNYKVTDLVESYNFYRNFISIWVHTKKLQFLENKLNRTAIPHRRLQVLQHLRCKRRTTRRLEHRSTSNRRTVWRLDPNAMWYDGSSIVLQIWNQSYIFEKTKKVIENKKNPE
jgi:hypothetical protein